MMRKFEDGGYKQSGGVREPGGLSMHSGTKRDVSR